jgi:hypothetical protein
MKKIETTKRSTNRHIDTKGISSLHAKDFEPLVDSLDNVDTKLSAIQESALSLKASAESLTALLAKQEESDEKPVPD